ncbi:glycoside hydrolase superfamily [Aspergillus unguis]
MRHLEYLSTLLLASANIATASPSAEQWASRSIYQVMTDRFARPAGSADKSCDPYKYCGGSWTGIIDKLDYIQDLGFTAVQISPVVENIPESTVYGEAYHGYWPQNLYALNEHFGSAKDLRKLSRELHKRGMYLMVDVVINNMAQAVNASSTPDEPDIDWSRLIPFDEEKYYHPSCTITDSDDADNSKDCWLSTEVVALPDLRTEDEKVVSMIQDWIKGLVGNYSIDGLRVDATRNMGDSYLTSFSEAAGVFTMGEVHEDNTHTICRYQDSVSGVLNYPLYGPMVQAFTAGDLPGLATKVRDVHSECKDFTRLATYMENHDTPRFASLVNDTTLAKNALAFNILSDGIPVVYQGQEQHMKGPSAPYNREPLWKTNYSKHTPLYNTTASLNKLRNHAIRLDKGYISDHSKELYVDGSTYVTRKGSEGSQVVAIYSNQGSRGGPYELAIPGAFAPGTRAVDVLSCSEITADDEGVITVEMNAGRPKAFFPVKKMKGSGLCGYKGRKSKAQLCKGSGKDKGNTTNTNMIHEGTIEQASSTSGITVPYTMVLLGVCIGVANWLF